MKEKWTNEGAKKTADKKEEQFQISERQSSIYLE